MARKTFVISLPNAWCKKYNVIKGQEIEIKENGRSLQIITDSEIDINKYDLDATNLDERALRWTLSSLHKSGHDEISIKLKDEKQFALVQELLKDLFMGFVVLEHTGNLCLLKSILKYSESEFNATLRRAFLVTIQMGKELIEAIKLNDLVFVVVLITNYVGWNLYNILFGYFQHSMLSKQEYNYQSFVF